MTTPILLNLPQHAQQMLQCTRLLTAAIRDGLAEEEFLGLLENYQRCFQTLREAMDSLAAVPRNAEEIDQKFKEIKEILHSVYREGQQALSTARERQQDILAAMERCHPRQRENGKLLSQEW